MGTEEKSSIEADQHYLDQSKPCEQDGLKPTVHRATNRKTVAAVIHDALPEIDKALSQANMSITPRKLEAFNFVRDTMLKVSDWKRLILSEAHGMIRLIIDDCPTDYLRGKT